jgi:hypothetical protein
MRYWQDETLEFDHNLLIQKGAYTFFDEPVRLQLIGLWQLTGMNSPETGQRIPWKEAIALTIKLIIYQDDGISRLSSTLTELTWYLTPKSNPFQVQMNTR